MYIYIIGAYERALKEQGSADVAYARLMLLGSAGTGKTSLKRSLMEEPFNPHTTSTIVSDVSSVRPFRHEWQTVRGRKWREATEEDEIEELAHLFNSHHSRPSSHTSALSAEYSHDESVSTSSIASDLNVESHIQAILTRAGSYSIYHTTKLLVQVSHSCIDSIYNLIFFSHFFIYGIVVVSQYSLRFSQPSSLLVQCFSSCLMLQRISEKDGSHVRILLMVKCCLVR